MHKLIDTHVHLDQLEDIENALKRGRSSGIEAILAVGTDYNSDIKLLDIVKSNHDVKIYLALGIHPTEINEDEIEATLRLIEENIKNIVAIGETGLDYWHKSVKKDKSKREKQQEVFKRQIELAKKYNLPVSIHSRGAWEDCLNFCLDAGIKKVIFH